MQRVTLIHNSTAGDGSPTGAKLRRLVARHHERVDYVSTGEDLDRALQDPGDLVVAAGGDGTVGRVASRLVGRAVPLAILPIGTANNVANALGLPIDATADAMIEAWDHAEPRLLDIGIARGPWGERHFIESAGIGFSAHAMTILSAFKEARGARRRTKVRLDRDRNALAELLAEYRTLDLELRVDAEGGPASVVGAFVMVEVLNMPLFGPRLRLAPAADPSDGALQLVVAGEAERSALCEWLRAGDASDSPVRSRPVRRLAFTWRGEPLRFDGHTWVGEDSPYHDVQTTAPGAGAAVVFELEVDRVPVLAPRDGRA